MSDHIPTGNPELDNLLRGGFPRGVLTCLNGPGNHKAFLAYKAIKEAAEAGLTIVCTQDLKLIENLADQVDLIIIHNPERIHWKQYYENPPKAAFVALVGEDCSKHLKFHAHLRLEVEEDQVRILKNILSDVQGVTLPVYL